METNNIGIQRGKEYFYACCPTCKHTLMQAANETDCYIKCGQCGSMIHIIVQDGNIITKKEQQKA